MKQENLSQPEAPVPKRWEHLPRRFTLLLFGTFFEAFGIAATTSAGIGTTPISTVPVALAAITGYTFGAMTFVMNLFMVAGQYVLLGRKFPLWNLMQIPGVLVFSLFIDLCMALFANHIPDPWLAKLLMSIMGNVFLAIGIIMQVQSKLLMQPGDAIVLAAAIRFKKQFSSMKIANDISLVVIAVALGWIFLHEIVGVREGTLISAILVGMLVRSFTIVAQEMGWIAKASLHAGEVKESVSAKVKN